MNRSDKLLFGGALAFIGSVVAIGTLKFAPVYGFGVFLGIPFAIGLLAGLLGPKAGAQSRKEVLGIACWVVGSMGLLFLSVGFEGLLCLAMALPLTLPLALLGAWIGYSISTMARRSNGLIVPALLLSPLMTTSEIALNPRTPLMKVDTGLEIAAPAETVWRNVIQFSTMAEPGEWMFRAGIAYPLRARLGGKGVGAIRYCDFSTGQVSEVVKVWNEPRELRFIVTQNPEPMREISPYDIHPPHLHGYFVSKEGRFVLATLPNGHTLVTGTSWYEQRLWPQVYWRLWSDAIVHRIHMRVLNHIKALSEN